MPVAVHQQSPPQSPVRAVLQGKPYPHHHQQPFKEQQQQPILDLPWKEIEGSLAWLMGRPKDRAVSAQIKALQDLFSDLKIKVGGPGVHISGFAAKWSELTIPDSSGTEDTEGEVNSAESNEVSVEEDLKGGGAASKESPLRKER